MGQRDSAVTAVPLNITTAGRLGMGTSHLQRDIAFIFYASRAPQAADANENPIRWFVASAASRRDWLLVVWLTADR